MKLYLFVGATIVIIIICLLYDMKTNKKIKEQEGEIKSYQVKLKQYEDRLSTLQLNNIVKTITIFKPSGERVVTKIIDKSSKQVTEEKKATEHMEGQYMMVNKTRAQEGGSSLKYIIGLSNLQLLSQNVQSYPVIVGLSYAPFSVFLDVPIKKDFYKNLTLNVTFSF